MGRRRLRCGLAIATSLALAGAMTAVNRAPAHADAEAADAASASLDITGSSDVVSILYSVWFNPVVTTSGTPLPNDISRIYEAANAAGTAPSWGPLGAFHYWDEPAGGYYRSDDRAVIRRHMAQIQSAGIDFIIIDNSNADSSWPTAYYDELFLDPVAVLLDEMLAMRDEGLDTPHVVFWNKTSSAEADPAFAGKGIRDAFYAPGTYDELFVEWDGKPLMLGTELKPASLDADFTQRVMWGLQPTLAPSEWSFLQPHPQQVSMTGSTAEQITVATAFQETYMSLPHTATPRRGGTTFATQWQRAFAARPKVVTVTWWNEWIAQRFEDSAGATRFVDNFTPEYSRDIEPSAGPLGSRYLDYLTAYVTAYKAHDPFPEGLVDDTMPLGDFETGAEGWLAGGGTASVSSAFQSSAQSVPTAASGKKVLDATSSAVNGDAWRFATRQFERPVDASEYGQLRLSLDHWGGAPGATDYEATLRITAADGTSVSTTVLSPGGFWQTISLDISSWPARDSITAIDVGFRAVGSGSPWVSKFFVDNVHFLQ
jgi:hypothetical protein